MQLNKSHIILRHRKENKKKCSLQGLENHPDFQFFTYPLKELPPIKDYILLTLHAPPLTKEDAGHPLFLIDGTWKKSAIMERWLQKQPVTFLRRSIPPHFRTAYPRRQEDCPNPAIGLASIEALFAAYHALGWEGKYLLENYYWKEDFLWLNGLI